MNTTYESIFSGVVAKLDEILEQEVRHSRLSLNEQAAIAQAIGIIETVSNEYQYQKEMGL
jgi:hypothetical protein